MKVSRRIMAMLLVVLLAGNCLSSVQAAPKETQPASEDVEVATEEMASEVEKETLEPEISEEKKDENKAVGNENYDPGVVATDPSVQFRDHMGNPIYLLGQSVSLIAPDGFLISANNSDEAVWSNEETFVAEEAGRFSYYLKNNSDDKVSVVKEYRYITEDLPEIESVQILGPTDASKAFVYKSGVVYCTGAVDVRIKTKETRFKFESISLYEGNLVIAELSEETNNQGRHSYVSEFSLSSVSDNLFVISAVYQDLVFDKTIEKLPYQYENNGLNNECQLVIDGGRPEIEIIEVKQNSMKYRTITAKFSVESKMVPLEQIEYGWDLKEGGFKPPNQRPDSEFINEYVIYDKFTEQTIFKYEGEIDLHFDNSSETADDLHRFYLRATNILGINYESDLKTGENDFRNPIIQNVLIETTMKNQTLIDKTYGVFSSAPLKVTVNAKDDDSKGYVSGIDMLSFASYVMTATKNVYVMNIPNGTVLNEISLYAIDNRGNYVSPNLSQIPKASGEGYYSDTLIVENTKPVITVFYDGKQIAESSLNNDETVWYNAKSIGKTIRLTARDDASGLSGVVLRNYEESWIKPLENKEGELTPFYPDMIYPSDRDGKIVYEEYEEYIIGGDSENSLSDRYYLLNAVVIDNAGNEAKEKSLYKFAVDTVAPEGELILTNIKEHGSWIHPKTKLEFMVRATDNFSGVNTIAMELNGTEIKTSKIKTDDEGSYVTFTVSDEMFDKDGEVEEIKIAGVVTDTAGNCLVLNSFEFSIDREMPTIEKLVVTPMNENGFLSKLKHGLYSNETLRVSAEAKDAHSGVATVELVYTVQGETKNVLMHKAEGSDIFYADIPALERPSVLETSIDIIATDMVGHEKSFGNTTLIEGKFANLLMLEKNIPVAKLELLPESSEEEEGEGSEEETSEETQENPGLTESETPWYSGKEDIAIGFEAQDIDSGIQDISLMATRQLLENISETDVLVDIEKNKLLKKEITVQATEKNTDLIKHQFSTAYISDLLGDEKKDEEEQLPGEEESSQQEASEDTSEASTEYANKEAKVVAGEYHLKYVITDNAGNKAEEELVYFIDAADPVIKRISFSEPDEEGKTEVPNDDVEDVVGTDILETEYGYFFKKSFDVSVEVTDEVPSSGLRNLVYKLVDKDNQLMKEESLTYTDGVATFNVPQGFKGQIYVQAYDNVSNTSGLKTTQAYVIDDVKPTITLEQGKKTSYKDADGYPLYTSPITVSVTMSDEGAGLKEIKLTQDSEKKGMSTEETGWKDFAPKGWNIVQTDRNLVTQIKKSVSFDEDNNKISVKATATDRANNALEDVKYGYFSIDMTAPVVNINFREDNDDDMYYNQDRIADITIKERNFDPNRMHAAIVNTFGEVPTVSYSKKSKDEYVATIVFGEGDYTFDYSGTDLANHVAKVNFAGGNEKMFFVDKTAPVITDNFATLVKADTHNNFNVEKTVSLRIEEHHFSPELVNLTVLRKNAGVTHSAEGFVNATAEVLAGEVWNSNGDVHSMEFTLTEDAVYQIQLSVTDLAGNVSETRTSAIFEIDTVAPIIVSRNGRDVSAQSTENVEVYPYTRANDPIPWLEFSDLNQSHLRYNLVTYIPVDKDGTTQMITETVYLDDDAKKQGIIAGGKFTLPKFSEDGVYALEIVAVDDAGNESILNVNTYLRLVKRDVLAYIMNSNIENKTGLYSFQYENGDPISMRPDHFSEIDIYVVTQSETMTDVVLRDLNGNEYQVKASVKTDNKIHGLQTAIYTISSEYFKETFQDDIDMELLLSVKNEENRIDLGKMHMDNIIPECEMPKGFKPWHWYYGKEERKITLTEINELLDVNACKVFDNGTEIPFIYSEEHRTLEFTLDKGWHNVGLILTDVAGNSYNIQELRNIHVGFFWLWIIIASAVVTLAITATGIVLFVRKRARDAF